MHSTQSLTTSSTTMTLPRNRFPIYGPKEVYTLKLMAKARFNSLPSINTARVEIDSTWWSYLELDTCLLYIPGCPTEEEFDILRLKKTEEDFSCGRHWFSRQNTGQLKMVDHTIDASAYSFDVLKPRVFYKSKFFMADGA